MGTGFEREVVDAGPAELTLERLGVVVGCLDDPAGVVAVVKGLLVEALIEVGGFVEGPCPRSADPLSDLLAPPGTTLSPLAALLLSWTASSVGPDLWKVFQSHSFSRELCHFALHPSPTPSTADLGSSCGLNESQFA
jgi:hypothetical protein